MPSRYRLGRLWNPPLVSSKGVFEALRALRPDVIDFHYRWSPSYQAAYRRARGMAGRAFTFQNAYGEGTGALRYASLANDRLAARWIRSSDRVLCVSEHVRRDLAARGLPRDRLRLVPNGIDAEAARAAAEHGRVPEALNGRRYVAAVGRLVPTKAFDVAIQALRRLPADVHLALIGQGPQAARLERAAARAGLAARVHLLGWVSEADKLRIVRDAAALAHPARFEAFGLAPLEALAVGTPVVASDVGGLPEVVGPAGVLVAPGDADRLAQGLARFLDADERRKARLVARRQAGVFGWDAAAALAETAYAEAARASKTT